MTDLRRFKGQVALVTGSANGIGKAIAQRFAEEGAKVVVADLNIADAEKTVSEIMKAGGTAIAVCCDVKSSAAIEAMIATTVENYEKIDILVNNAGDVTISKHFFETDEAWWDHFLDTNLKSQ